MYQQNLGGGVWAEWDGDAIILMSESGDRIVLTQDIHCALEDWLFHLCEQSGTVYSPSQGYGGVGFSLN